MIESDTTILLPALLTQAVMTAVLAALTHGFARTYNHAYLRWWSYSWAACTVYLIASASSVGLRSTTVPSSPARLSLTALSLVAGYLHILFFLFGSWNISMSRPVPRPWFRAGFAASVTLGVVATLLFVGEPTPSWHRFVARVGARALVGGVAFLIAAYLASRVQSAGRSTGRRLFVFALSGYGAVQLFYCWLSLAQSFGWRTVPAVDYLSLADTIIQAVIGLAMIGWLLEEESNRADERAREATAAGAALREQEQYYRTLIEGGSDIIAVLGPDGDIRYESPSMTRLFGWELEEMLGRSAFEFVHPDDLARVAEEFAAGLADPEVPRAAQFRHRRKAGRWLLLEAVGRLIPEADGGEPTIVVNSRDITDRARAEDARRRSEELLALHIRQTPLGVIEWDREFRVREWNPAAERIFGWSRDEVIGMPATAFVPPDTRAEVDALWQALSTGRDGERSSLTNVRRDGVFIDCEWYNSPLVASGVLIGAASFVQDVSERRRIEHQLAQAQRMESIGRLAGGVAHDFNNLLTAIFGGVAAVREGVAAGDSVLGDLTAIEQAAERAATLTRQLLAFARQQVVVPRTLDLNDLLLGLVQVLRRVIGAHIELVTITSPENTLVHIDSGQLEQVILNLVVNARDAMPEGGRLGIETALFNVRHREMHKGESVEAGEYVTLTVTDTGSGIPPDVRPHIFEPFFTTKGLGQGTGLGLATSYGIVRQHGGHLWCASRVGVGSTFTVCLPRAEALTAAPAEKRTGHPVPAGQETILIVEDEPAVRSVAARVLRKHGHMVLEADDGQHALDLIRQTKGRVDLVLTDLVMPRLGGLALAARLRNEFPTVDVCFTSGYSEDAQGLDALTEAGTFLRKPFNPDDLLRFVRRALDDRRASSTSNS